MNKVSALDRMKLAVVKPDHLGDLVLSRPAITALREVSNEVTLFVNGRTLALAHYLFPSIEVREFNLPHLHKDRQRALEQRAATNALLGFEMVVFLRDDRYLQGIASGLPGGKLMSKGDLLTHETQIQRAAIAELITYQRTALFPNGAVRWPSEIRSVGLCIAAGFPTNRWPEIHWIELAQRLRLTGKELYVIAGPAEATNADYLGRILGLSQSHVVVGSGDYASLLAEVARCDVVIAVDGGTAHICSLVRPVLSVFGSSPWRRYSPFGRSNRTVSLDLFCSPCVQFSKCELNACFSRECLAALTPDIVIEALTLNDCNHSVRLSRGRCWFGVSHLAAGENFRMLDD